MKFSYFRKAIKNFSYQDYQTRYIPI